MPIWACRSMSRSRREVATRHQRIDVALSGDLLDVMLGNELGDQLVVGLEGGQFLLGELAPLRADDKGGSGRFIFGARGEWAGHHRQCRARYKYGDRDATRGALIMDSKSKPGWGSWLVLGVLIGLLCLAIVVLYVSWDPEQSGAMTGAGYVAMVLGIIATLALGVGLMALMYYSNRSGRD